MSSASRDSFDISVRTASLKRWPSSPLCGEWKRFGGEREGFWSGGGCSYYYIHCLAKQHVKESLTVITECFRIGRPVARTELTAPFRRWAEPRPQEKLSCRLCTKRPNRRKTRRALMLQLCLLKVQE